MINNSENILHCNLDKRIIICKSKKTPFLKYMVILYFFQVASSCTSDGNFDQIELIDNTKEIEFFQGCYRMFTDSGIGELQLKSNHSYEYKFINTDTSIYQTGFSGEWDVLDSYNPACDKYIVLNDWCKEDSLLPKSTQKFYAHDKKLSNTISYIQSDSSGCFFKGCD